MSSRVVRVTAKEEQEEEERRRRRRKKNGGKNKRAPFRDADEPGPVFDTICVLAQQ